MARLRWVVRALPMVAGIVFLLWLVLLAPKLLIPARSPGSLADVRDPAKRHELEDGRLKLQNDVRTPVCSKLSAVALSPLAPSLPTDSYR
jgi:hypothetical protein